VDGQPWTASTRRQRGEGPSPRARSPADWRPPSPLRVIAVPWFRGDLPQCAEAPPQLTAERGW